MATIDLVDSDEEEVSVMVVDAPENATTSGKKRPPVECVSIDDDGDTCGEEDGAPVPEVQRTVIAPLRPLLRALNSEQPSKKRKQPGKKAASKGSEPWAKGTGFGGSAGHQAKETAAERSARQVQTQGDQHLASRTSSRR